MNHLETLVEPIVFINGTRLAAEEVRTLTAIRVRQRLSNPTQCELVFAEPQHAVGGGALLRPGAAVRIGVSGQHEPLFDGELTAIEIDYHPSQATEVRARGYDALHRLRKRHEIRSHVQVTPLDLAREMASEIGVSVESSEPGPLRQIIIQQNRSNLDLLVDELASCGLYLTLRGKTLHIAPLDGIDAPVPLALGESLLEAHFEVNGEPSCRSVAVSAWDTQRVEHHEGRAARARVGREVMAEAAPTSFGAKGEITLSDVVMADGRHAQALAQAELDRRVAAEVVFRGTAAGDTRLRPGARVRVAGVADQFAGQYSLTEVTHTIDGRVGYVSELCTAPPTARRRDRNAVVTKGIVTRVSDPDGRGFVRVELPTYGGVETDWIGVLSAGAGAGKGLLVLPDVGDQVLVLFVNEDPAQSIVLGGLFGVKGTPDPGVDGESIRRFTLLTGKGQKIQLNDTAGTIRIENQAGSYVELAPKKVLIHAETDLELEAPGKSVVIRGRAIDFEKG